MFYMEYMCINMNDPLIHLQLMENLGPGIHGQFVLRHVMVEHRHELVPAIVLHQKMADKIVQVIQTKHDLARNKHVQVGI